MDILQILLICLYLASSYADFSHADTERDANDKRMQERLVMDEVIDLKVMNQQIKKLQEKGYIAGKRYDDPGSGSDTQCLPSDPTWNRYNIVPDYLRATIYGTEIDIQSASHVFEKDVLNENMPCTFCRTDFPTTVTFPARNDCYTGWTLQYSGYLVTNKGGSGRGAYQSFCLDKDPDFVPGTLRDDNEHVLYLIEAKCGSLPCPPYIGNAEIACAVCSK